MGGRQGVSNEGSIYSLISSPSNPITVQLAVLLFDAVGYESFFRGVLQRGLQAKMGVVAAPAIALLDAGLRFATFNPYGSRPPSSRTWSGASLTTMARACRPA